MKVTVISGVHKGKTGSINGDLAERKKTLGRDGKVMVKFYDNVMRAAKPGEIVFIRTKHLIENMELAL